MKRKFLLAVFMVSGLFLESVMAQETYNVLFIGNSYTGVNNLPKLVADIAASKGDEIIYDTHTPGGNTFEQHSANPTALAKIADGNWDYVVLQEQSQRPAFSPGQVSNDVYPYAKRLCDTIRFHNPCATPLFYMTWGRENGDASNCDNYPPICTFEGMQERLTASYTEMADNNDYAAVAPVGEAWKALRESNPEINLYSGDGSHPSIHGSYLAACVFYTSITKESSIGALHPTNITDEEASVIENIADNTVFNRFEEWNFPYITASIADNEVTYALETNGPTNIVEWSFVNNQSSIEVNPTIAFQDGVDNEATVSYTYDNCDHKETNTVITISNLSITENNEVDLLQLAEKQYQINNPVAENTQISVYSTNGQLVIEKRTKATKIALDLSALSSGSYIIRVLTNDTQASKKIMIY